MKAESKGEQDLNVALNRVVSNATEHRELRSKENVSQTKMYAAHALGNARTAASVPTLLGPKRTSGSLLTCPPADSSSAGTSTRICSSLEINSRTDRLIVPPPLSTVSYFLIPSVAEDPTFLAMQKEIMPAGEGMVDVQLLVVYRNDKNVPCACAGEVGNIYVRSGGLAEGYPTPMSLRRSSSPTGLPRTRHRAKTPSASRTAPSRVQKRSSGRAFATACTAPGISDGTCLHIWRRVLRLVLQIYYEHFVRKYITAYKTD